MTDKEQLKIKEACVILLRNKVKYLELCNFGIYYQYELAGEKISPDTDAIYSNESIEENDAEELVKLLEFACKDSFIMKKLKFPDEGQNKLVMDNKGNFTFKRFTI